MSIQNPSRGVSPSVALIGGCLALLALQSGDGAVAGPVDRQDAPITVGAEESRVVVLRGSESHPFVLPRVAVNRGFLGVHLLDLTPELRAHFAVPEDRGVMISRVVEDGPAAEAGIRVGDILTLIDGEPVREGWMLAHQVGSRDEGQSVELEVWRAGRPLVFSVVLSRRERPQIDVGRLLWSTESFEPGRLLLEEPLAIDPEDLGEAFERLQKELDDPEWQERLRLYREQRGDLFERLEGLETRLRELERQLESLPRP